MRHKRGDEKDGMVFWAYQSSNRPQRERWVTREKFNLLIAKEKQRTSMLVLPKERNHKRGDKRNDGKIFWAYGKTSKNGEIWITPERFKTKIENNRKSDQKRKISICPKRAKWSKEYNRRIREEKRPCLVNYETKRRAFFKTEEGRKILSERAKERRKRDPMFVIKSRVRCRLHEAFRQGGYLKKSKTEKIIGCSWAKLKRHIESQFQEGMSWENRNLWQIDHIIPLYCATTEEGIVKLNHFKNLRPIWKQDNLKKRHHLQLVS